MESLSDRLRYVLFESAQNCLRCQYYSDGECSEAKKVIDAHGQDHLNDWLKYPDDLNGCNYFEIK